MAEWLNARLPANATVLVSPALRAQQTAAALKRDCITSDALDTSTDAAALLRAVAHAAARAGAHAGGHAKDGAATLVVGHQPTLGNVASLLLTGTEGDLSVRKAAVWWITLHGERRELGVLKAVMTPELL